MHPETRELCQGSLLPSSWYPQAAYTEFIECTARVIDPTDPARIAFDWGCW